MDKTQSTTPVTNALPPVAKPAAEQKPAKKKLSLEITEVEEVLERKISP
jgi:hypothetical protein